MTTPPNRPGDMRQRLPVGTVLGDAYAVEAEIGAGGFGITYRGRDLTLGHLVAIKEYFPAEIGNRDSTMSVHPASQALDSPFMWGRDGFLREAKMLAAFRHPNIVRVLRYFEANNTAYMVLEFEAGQSFSHWLKSLGRSPTQPEIDAILQPLCDALSTIHAQRLVHRDIAPDNIIIREDGSPVLLDFGAARYEVASQTQVLRGPVHTTSYAVVKAHYSPIEQRSTDISRRGPWSDVYSLGATLYRAVTGQVPPDSHERLASDHDTLAPTAQAVYAGGWRSGFLAAIDWALAMKPGERPQSIAAFRELAFSSESRAVSIVRAAREATRASDDDQTLDKPGLAERPRELQSFTTVEDQRTVKPATKRERSWTARIAAAGLLVAGLGAMAAWLGVQRDVTPPSTTAQLAQPAANTGPQEDAAKRTTGNPAGNNNSKRPTDDIARRKAEEEARVLAAEKEAEARRLKEEAEKRALAEKQAAEAERARVAAQQKELAKREAETRAELEREKAARIAAEAEAARMRELAQRERREAEDRHQRLVAGRERQAEEALRKNADAGPVQTAFIEAHRNTYVEGNGYEFVTGSNFAACEKRCLANDRCALFEFYKPETKCALFDVVGKTAPDKDADVGIKRFRPQKKPGPNVNRVSAPPAAPKGPTARLERRLNYFFEGDGYDLTLNTTYEACEARCAGDDRCKAMEFYKPKRQCNLYSTVPAKGGSDPSADTGIKK